MSRLHVATRIRVLLQVEASGQHRWCDVLDIGSRAARCNKRFAPPSHTGYAPLDLLPSLDRRQSEAVCLRQQVVHAGGSGDDLKAARQLDEDKSRAVSAAGGLEVIVGTTRPRGTRNALRTARRFQRTAVGVLIRICHRGDPTLEAQGTNHAEEGADGRSRAAVLDCGEGVFVDACT